MNRTDPATPFERLAEMLSTMPDLNIRILADHPADGVCTGCTTPGGRGPATAAPCSIRQLALFAEQIAGEEPHAD